jgi:divalent metal cation (Fe/Co/Zn/Cd) transporter
MVFPHGTHIGNGEKMGNGNAGNIRNDAPVSIQLEKEHTIRTSLSVLFFGLGVKTVTTIVGGSLIQITDLFRSFSEVLAVGFSYVILKKTGRGRYDISNSEYARLENLASRVVAGVLIFSFFVVICGMAIRIEIPRVNGILVYGLIVAIVSFSLDFYFWRRNFRLSLQEYSPIMNSQWRLFLTKALVNLCVILTLVLSLLLQGNPCVVYIDITGSAVVGAFMLFTAYRILTT